MSFFVSVARDASRLCSETCQMLAIVVMQGLYMYDPLMKQLSVVDMVHSIMQDIKSRCRIGLSFQFR